MVVGMDLYSEIRQAYLSGESQRSIARRLEISRQSVKKYCEGKTMPGVRKAYSRIYLLREGEIFPMILSLPTGSLKDFTRYIMRLLSKGKKSNAVVTKFALKKATNNSGIAYSKAQFSVDRDLTAEEYALISGLTEQVKTFSTRVGYDTEPAADTPAVNVDPETGEVIEPLA